MARTKKPHVDLDLRGTSAHLDAVEGVIHATKFIVHTAEQANHPGLSDLRAMFNYLDGTPYWVTFGIDKEGNFAQAARLRDKLYHAGNANGYANGCELLAYASMTRKDWLGTRRAQLRKLSELIAWWAQQTHNPISAKTIIGHRDVPGADHTDPGDGFPMRRLRRDARYFKLTGRHLAFKAGGLGRKGT